MSLATNAGTAKYVSYREAQLDALTRAKRSEALEDFIQGVVTVVVVLSVAIVVLS